MIDEIVKEVLLTGRSRLVWIDKEGADKLGEFILSFIYSTNNHFVQSTKNTEMRKKVKVPLLKELTF